MRTLPWTLIVLFAGCGSDGNTTYTPRSFTREVMRIQCDGQKRCCMPPQAPADVQACADALLANSDVAKSVQDFEAALASGGATIDQAAAARCLAQFKVSYGVCDANLDRSFNAICSEVMVGTVPAGRACGNVARCAPGLVCTYTTMMCVTPAGPGQACSNEKPCVTGYSCSGPTCTANPTPAPVTVRAYLCNI